MLRISLNTDKKLVKEIDTQLKENGGYCPCMIEQTPDTKCMCKTFREQQYPGECHCGKFVKEEV